NILRRMREISIRKVLGASIAHIIGLINREYLVIFSIAGLLGVGAGYFSAEVLLSSIFEYHNGVSLTAFLMAIGALLSVCVVTVGSKVYRAANANPTDVLRSE
ncbi:MAG: FtsX-like permease family protein, partial [Bacteroidetes bacterium]|nr:FtsX-like permease family protein [Bacteroidota bacterium]